MLVIECTFCCVDGSQAADGAALWRDERRQRGARRASLTRRGDGMWDLHARLTGAVGAKVATEFDALDRPDGPDSPDETRRTPTQRRADALERLVDVMLDRGLVDATGGIARPHLSVHVDADTLRHDLTATNPATSSHGADGAVAPDDPAWDGLPAGTTDWGDMVSPPHHPQPDGDAPTGSDPPTGSGPPGRGKDPSVLFVGNHLATTDAASP